MLLRHRNRIFSRRSGLTALAVAILSINAVVATPAYAVVPTSHSEVDTDERGLAMQGYDPVAYFAEGAPRKGNPHFKVTHDGATYHFASADNMKLFKADPGAYLPQYGGFCAMGAAMGHKFDGDPNVWKIVDNKLYLNFNPDVGRRWSTDIPTNIVRANDNWPTIKKQTPEELK